MPRAAQKLVNFFALSHSLGAEIMIWNTYTVALHDGWWLVIPFQIYWQHIVTIEKQSVLPYNYTVEKDKSWWVWDNHPAELFMRAAGVVDGHIAFASNQECSSCCVLIRSLICELYSDQLTRFEIFCPSQYSSIKTTDSYSRYNNIWQTFSRGCSKQHQLYIVTALYSDTWDYVHLSTFSPTTSYFIGNLF